MAAQSHRLSFHSVRRESGSKWEDARPSRERREIICRTPAVTVKYYSLWFIDQRNLLPSCRIVHFALNAVSKTAAFITLSTCWLSVVKMTTEITTACCNVSTCSWIVRKLLYYTVRKRKTCSLLIPFWAPCRRWKLGIILPIQLSSKRTPLLTDFVVFGKRLTIKYR